MRTVEWSAKAEKQLAAWIDHLVDAAGPELAQRAYEGVLQKANGLAYFSGHRRSRWSGYQELSLREWHKIIVFRLTHGCVFVTAIYDMRQDFSAVSPETE